MTRVGELLAGCADAHAGEADPGRVRHLLGPADALAVSGDPEQLRRTVGQLLRNALDASPDPARLWAEPAGDRVRVCVADGGPGPAPQAVPHLFDPFFSGRDAGRGRGGAR